MICLKNRTFAVSQTTFLELLGNTQRCDLLEKSYFCSIANNQTFNNYAGQQVVICLKNRTFAVSQTTETFNRVMAEQLWFAWKIVLLQYRKQLIVLNTCTEFCCDLLEKSYFCSIANNTSVRYFSQSSVVICLKNRTFAVSQTTGGSTRASLSKLWFAWKIVLLQYRKQPMRSSLLSTRVVICLKNRTFAVSQTTGRGAFRYWASCDLLEKSYFCSIANNHRPNHTPHHCVVICLKNRTFAVSQTTESDLLRAIVQLWFAWKIVLLQYRKQPCRKYFTFLFCCDLLEKSYFCSIANNFTR